MAAEAGTMAKHAVRQVLVVCNGLMAAGLLYEAFHLATYAAAFPDSAGMRWLNRFEELFPSVSVLPRAVALLAEKVPAFALTQVQRWPLAFYAIAAAVATAALAYGLSQAAEWARKTFFVIALTQLSLAALKLGGIALHVVAVGLHGLGGYLTGVMNTRIPASYTLLGAFVAAGIAGLMWRWGNVPVSDSGGQDTDTHSARAMAFNAWAEVKSKRLTGWTAVIRGALACQFVAIMVMEFSDSHSPHNWSNGELLVLTVWTACVATIWIFLSTENPRLGVGLALGYGLALALPLLGLLGLPFLLLFLGFRSWPQLVLAGVAIVSVLVLLICAIRASILLKKAPVERAGEWGLGVLMPLIAVAVFFQVLKESTYAKAPARSREMVLRQSREFERGHSAGDVVHLIAKCAFYYAAAHPQEGFPKPLQQLGTVGGSCAPLASGKPQVEGHTFEYQASREGAAGPLDKFTARSREIQRAPGTFSLPDLLVNQTGVFVRLERPPFSFSPALALVNNISGCLRSNVANSGAGYPSNLRGLLAIKGEYGIPCTPAFEANELSVLQLWSNHFRYQFYDFTYTPTEDQGGKFLGFRLEARPSEYGKVAIRSYLADQSGVVHATPFDRAATPSDSDASCETKQPQQCFSVDASAGNF
jgi:hypothetical protein